MMITQKKHALIYASATTASATTTANDASSAKILTFSFLIFVFVTADSVRGALGLEFGLELV